MNFDVKLQPVPGDVLRAVGYGAAPPDEKTEETLRDACDAIVHVATPRWVWRQFTLRQPPCLEEARLALPGEDILLHLAGCTACILLALSLGDGVERATRAAEATDMARAVLMDAAASTLVEQYADEAERQLRRQASAEGRYLTSRFSPGYGDLPLALQPDIVRLLGTPKAIGLSVAQSGILLPRKSITAVLGLSDHPVKGRQAGCESCAINETCTYRKEGRACGDTI